MFRICPPNITELKKAKEDKFCQSFNYFYFKCAINLRDYCKKMFRETKTCPLNITFLRKFFHRVFTRSIKSLFLSKKPQLANMQKK